MNQSVYLSEKEVARRWGISCRTLQRWRRCHRGPAYLKICGTVRYTQEAILSYEKERHFSELHPLLRQKRLEAKRGFGLGLGQDITIGCPI